MTQMFVDAFDRGEHVVIVFEGTCPGGGWGSSPRIVRTHVIAARTACFSRALWIRARHVDADGVRNCQLSLFHNGFDVVGGAEFRDHFTACHVTVLAEPPRPPTADEHALIGAAQGGGT